MKKINRLSSILIKFMLTIGFLVLIIVPFTPKEVEISEIGTRGNISGIAEEFWSQDKTREIKFNVTDEQLHALYSSAKSGNLENIEVTTKWNPVKGNYLNRIVSKDTTVYKIASVGHRGIYPNKKLKRNYCFSEVE